MGNFQPHQNILSTPKKNINITKMDREFKDLLNQPVRCLEQSLYLYTLISQQYSKKKKKHLYNHYISL